MMKVRCIAILVASAVGLVAQSATAAPPPKLKSKAGMLDDEIDQRSGGQIKEAQKKADKNYKALRKARTYEAIKKKQEEEARRRRAAEEARRRKAEQEAKAARAKAAAAKKAKAKAEKDARDAELARIAEIRAEAKALRKSRSARMKAQRDAARSQWKALGDKETRAKYVAELKVHGRRQARLRRVQEVAAEAGDYKALDRVTKAMKRENTRHSAQLKAMGVPQ